MITDISTKELVEKKFYTNDAPDIKITEINVNPVTNSKVTIKRDDSTAELEKGSDFEVSQKSGGKQSWYAYDYNVKKKNFDDEGGYSLTVSSTDIFKKVIQLHTFLFKMRRRLLQTVRNLCGYSVVRATVCIFDDRVH